MNNVILIDASGSMGELGKASVIRYLLYTIERFFMTEMKNKEYKILLWNDVIEEYKSDVQIIFDGKNNINKIVDELDTGSQLLLISDGNILDNSSKKFSDIPNSSKMVVLVGSDSNMAKMQKVFGVDNVFDAADIETCLCKLKQRN